MNVYTTIKNPAVFSWIRENGYKTINGINFSRMKKVKGTTELEPGDVMISARVILDKTAEPRNNRFICFSCNQINHNKLLEGTLTVKDVENSKPHLTNITRHFKREVFFKGPFELYDVLRVEGNNYMEENPDNVIDFSSMKQFDERLFYRDDDIIISLDEDFKSPYGELKLWVDDFRYMDVHEMNEAYIIKGQFKNHSIKTWSPTDSIKSIIFDAFHHNKEVKIIRAK